MELYDKILHTPDIDGLVQDCSISIGDAIDKTI